MSIHDCVVHFQSDRFTANAIIMQLDKQKYCLFDWVAKYLDFKKFKSSICGIFYPLRRPHNAIAFPVRLQCKTWSHRILQLICPLLFPLFSWLSALLFPFLSSFGFFLPPVVLLVRLRRGGGKKILTNLNFQVRCCEQFEFSPWLIYKNETATQPHTIA